MGFMILMCAIAGMILTGVCIWACQLLLLMSLKNEQFPGKYDKILWFIVVFFDFIPGALLFLYYWKTDHSSIDS